MKLISSLLVFCIVLGISLIVTAEVNPQEAGKSVYLLYSQNESGGMEMHCTATAFDSVKGRTRFITAAHCVVKNADVPGRSGLEISRDPMFLSDDSPSGEKKFVRVTVDTVGRVDEGYDFAFLSAVMESPVIKLGEVPELGDEVFNVAAPMGLGKVYFTGHVALAKIDRPLFFGSQHINWQDFMMLQLQSEGGSSGSAVISRKSGKIVGLIIGGMQSLTIGLPIARTQTREAKFLMRLDGKDFKSPSETTASEKKPEVASLDKEEPKPKLPYELKNNYYMSMEWKINYLEEQDLNRQ